MDQQQLLEHYKECYYHEFQHKDSINNRIALPAGILPLLAAGDIYIIKHLENLKPSWLDWGIGLVVLYSILLMLSVYYICRTSYNHKYAYAVSPQQVYDYRKSLERDGYTQQVIEEEMTDFLSAEFSKFASFNRDSNLYRVQFLRFTFFCIVGTLIIGLFCIPVYTFGEKEDANTTKVELIKKEVKKNMSSNQNQKPPVTNRPTGVIINENFTKDAPTPKTPKKE